MSFPISYRVDFTYQCSQLFSAWGTLQMKYCFIKNNNTRFHKSRFSFQFSLNTQSKHTNWWIIELLFVNAIDNIQWLSIKLTAVHCIISSSINQRQKWNKSFTFLHFMSHVLPFCLQWMKLSWLTNEVSSNSKGCVQKRRCNETLRGHENATAAAWTRDFHSPSFDNAVN